MNKGLMISKISVADFLKSTPTAVRFFLDQGTACAGCYLARFCTLRDVIRVYHLDEKVFVEALARLPFNNPIC
jgi:hypothetical protein